MPVLIDSGADKAVFDGSAATVLGILDITTGILEKNQGIGGTKDIWYHPGVCLAIKDAAGNHAALQLAQAGFDLDLKISGLVGRASFFEAFRITFEEHHKRVILELIESAPNLMDWQQVPFLLPQRRGRGRRP